MRARSRGPQCAHATQNRLTTQNDAEQPHDKQSREHSTRL